MFNILVRYGVNVIKEQLIKEFNKLGILDMEEVTELHEGKGVKIATDVSVLLQIWIFFLFALMKKAEKIPNW